MGSVVRDLKIGGFQAWSMSFLCVEHVEGRGWWACRGWSPPPEKAISGWPVGVGSCAAFRNGWMNIRISSYLYFMLSSIAFDCVYKQFLESSSLAAMKKIFPHVRPQSCHIRTAPLQTHGVFSNQTSARLPEQAGNAVGGTTMTQWQLRKEAPMIERCCWNRFGLIGTITCNVIRLCLFHIFLLKFGWYPNSIPTSHLSALSKKRVRAIGGPWAGGSNAKQWWKPWSLRLPWCTWCATWRIFAQKTWNPVLQSLATSNTDTLIFINLITCLAGSPCIWRSKMASNGHGQWLLCFHGTQKTTVGDFFGLWRGQQWCRRLRCTWSSLNFGMLSQPQWNAFFRLWFKPWCRKQSPTVHGDLDFAQGKAKMTCKESVEVLTIKTRHCRVQLATCLSNRSVLGPLFAHFTMFFSFEVMGRMSPYWLDV